jgi:MFS transporter, ACS family, hexuronate transporter
MAYRWIAIAVFLLSSALNYMDRVLVGSLVVSLTKQFSLSASDFANQQLIFSLVYAACTPLMGILIDRFGLMRASVFAVAGWSMACASTGLATTWNGLIGTRVLLAVFESGGIALTSKAFALYLKPEERALGGAVSQLGLTLGGAGAGFLAATVGEQYGWPAAFFAAGALGLVWIPLWWMTARLFPPGAAAASEPVPAGEVWRSPTLWGLVLVNILIMLSYSLWLTVWTTKFFVTEFGLTARVANLYYAWVPALFAAGGGFTGAWWARALIRGGMEPLAARRRIFLLAAPFVAGTIFAPHMPNAAAATAMISLSLFATVCLSTNLYAMPLDLFPASRVAFAVSLLTFGYGLLGSVWSKAIGMMVDHSGFLWPCLLAGLSPLAAMWTLHRVMRSSAVLR